MCAPHIHPPPQLPHTLTSGACAQQSFYDDKGVHRMKITDQDFHVKIFGAKISEFGGSRFIPAEVREKTQMVADTKFKHCGWVRQNDARSKFWKATQPADWGKEPEVHIMPTLALIAALSVPLSVLVGLT